MLIEIGPRSIGRCSLRLQGCTAKGFNIVKKVLMAKDGKTVWICQHCLKVKENQDQNDYEKNKNRNFTQTI